MENPIKVPIPVFTSARPGANGDGARAHRARQIAGQWIVAAGIEQQQAGLGFTLHLLENQRERQGFEINIPFARQPRIDGNEVVLPADLNAVAGVKEQGNVRPLQRKAELPDGALHGPLVEIAPVGHLEAQTRQRRGHVGGVVAGISEFAGVLVGRIADHQRHAFFGEGGAR